MSYGVKYLLLRQDRTVLSKGKVALARRVSNCAETQSLHSHVAEEVHSVPYERV